MNEFYVYALCNPLSEVNISYKISQYTLFFQYEPFYIGKGVKSRLTDHFSKNMLSKNTPKNKKILRLLALGHKPLAIKLFTDLSEPEAYNLEKMVIATLGKNILCNICDGGVGISSADMLGDKNPMYGKKRPQYVIDAMQEGRRHYEKINSSKGKKLEDIIGIEKARNAKLKMSLKRVGKSWDDYFGKDTADRIKQERRESRLGTHHSKETIEKITQKLSTPENKVKRRIAILNKRKAMFDYDLDAIKDVLKQHVNNGYTNAEVIKRFPSISRFRLQKMIYLVKNNLTSDYYFVL